jgi:hypothetical protein
MPGRTEKRAEEFVRKQLDLWVRKPKAPSARRRCSFDLPVGLADRLRAVCALEGHTMREVAQILFQAYVDEHARQPNLDRSVA